MIVYDRWNGSGLPKVTASRIAQGINQRERHGGPIQYRVAGGDILEKKGHGESIFELFSAEGIHYLRADNRRQSGWTQLRERLVGKDDTPMIYWFESCEDDIESIGSLQHDIHDQNDTAPGDDHDADRIRYMCMARPWVKSAPPIQKTVEERFKKPTIEELWALRESQLRDRR